MDLKGISRLNFVNENFFSNGDAHREIIEKFKSGNLLFPIFSMPLLIASNDILRVAYQTTSMTPYDQTLLTRSMLHIQRTASVTMTTMTFNSNHLIENAC